MLTAKCLLLFSLKFYKKKHTVLIYIYIWLCINKMNSNNSGRDSKEEFTYLRVVCRYTCAWTYMHREARDQNTTLCVFLKHFSLYFWDRVFHWAGSSWICLDWLNSQLQGSSCLHFFSTGNYRSRKSYGAFHVGGGNPHSVLDIYTTALYWSHFPGHNGLLF